MKREFYAVDYWATKTLQNGNEKETIQTVYFPKRDDKGRYTDWDIFSVCRKAEEDLINQHFYKLIFKGTRTINLNIVM